MKQHILVGIGVAANLAFAAAGQEGAEAPPVDPRLTTVRTLDTLHPFTPPSDLAAWEARAKELRLRIRIAAGLDPEPPRTPLRFQSYRTIDRGEYTVENVAFESVPGFFVTGNLYRPKGEASGKRPGILSPHGHWENGRHFERSEADAKREIERGAEQTMEGARFPLQARCAQLARMGCVVLFYDMVGYADNDRIGHGDGFGDFQAESYGLSTFGLQTWDSIRALDALVALPDVDPERIAITGASGGGTQTFVLTALDDRVKVAFPAVMVSSRMQGGCICENASNLRIGTDNVEIAALTAPRPLGMTGANDWTLHIETEGLPELKRVYALYGAEENVAAWCHPEFDHNYNQVSRQHMYGFMNRHLVLEQSEPILERSFEPIPPADLHVFGGDVPRPPSADATAVREFLMKCVERQPFANATTDEALWSVVDRYRESLRVLLDVNEFDPSDIAANVPASAPGADGSGSEIQLDLADGTSVRIVRFENPDFKLDWVVIATSSSGSGAFADGLTPGSGEPRLLLHNLGAREVLIVEPLGRRTTAEPGPALPVDAERHAKFPGYTYAYNRTVQAERVRDVHAVIAYVLGKEPSSKIGLVGIDGGAWTMALVRATVRRHAASVGRTLLRFDDDYDGVSSIDDERFVPGLARYGGMTTVLGLCAPGDLFVMTSKTKPTELWRLFVRRTSSGLNQHSRLYWSSDLEDLLLAFRRGR